MTITNWLPIIVSIVIMVSLLGFVTSRDKNEV